MKYKLIFMQPLTMIQIQEGNVKYDKCNTFFAKSISEISRLTGISSYRIKKAVDKKILDNKYIISSL